MINNVVIIGGGIVGLASALRIKEANPRYKVVVLEKENRIASHQTGHNSGVIHSGLYYKPGSYKAKNCVDGYRQLVTFCEEEGINYELCGKIVVATSQKEIPHLHNLAKRGKRNGLDRLKLLQKEELKEYEPHVNGIKALHVPYTGIVDYKAVCDKFSEKFQHFGGEIHTNCEVRKFRKKEELIEVVTNSGTFITRLVVNCGGLHSDRLTKKSGLKPSYRIIPFRGEYYQLKPQAEHLVRNLIYPVPNPNFPFLGVHFTRMINGGIEAGPNAVLAYRREGYTKSDIHLGEFLGSLTYRGFRKVAIKYWKTGLGELYRSYSKSAFTRALQKLIPEIQKKDLEKAEAGVRAQACSRKIGLVDDFLVFEHKQFINIGNAPSPAATSSLAIGQQVADLVVQKLSK